MSQVLVCSLVGLTSSGCQSTHAKSYVRWLPEHARKVLRQVVARARTQSLTSGGCQSTHAKSYVRWLPEHARKVDPVRAQLLRYNDWDHAPFTPDTSNRDTSPCSDKKSQKCQVTRRRPTATLDVSVPRQVGGYDFRTVNIDSFVVMHISITSTAAAELTRRSASDQRVGSSAGFSTTYLVCTIFPAALPKPLFRVAQSNQFRYVDSINSLLLANDLTHW